MLNHFFIRRKNTEVVNISDTYKWMGSEYPEDRETLSILENYQEANNCRRCEDTIIR